MSQTVASKAEETKLTPEEVSEYGELAQSEVKEFSRSGLEYSILEQKKAFRPFIFYGVLVIAAIFYLLALTLAARVIYLLWCLRLPDVPHGVLFLVASLCIPPTVLVIMAMRSLLEHKHEDKKEEAKAEDFAPVLKLLNEGLKAITKPS